MPSACDWILTFRSVADTWKCDGRRQGVRHGAEAPASSDCRRRSRCVRLQTVNRREPQLATLPKLVRSTGLVSVFSTSNGAWQSWTKSSQQSEPLNDIDCCLQWIGDADTVPVVLQGAVHVLIRVPAVLPASITISSHHTIY
ncbi:hypothetical protein VTK26DRAFT_2232 [Humicola hyalothermophila]